MTKLQLRIVCLVASFMLHPSSLIPALAQPGCTLRTFTMADGLPSGTITMCATAPDGMLWIATWNGLCNYDGYRFNSFAVQPGAEQVLTSNRLRSLMPVEGGDVWLTTFDDSLYLFNGKTSNYTLYHADSPQAPPLPLRHAILKPSEDGVLRHTDFAGTQWQLMPDGRFGYIDGDTQAFVPVDIQASDASKDDKFVMSKVIADKRGDLWFTRQHNLYQLSFHNYSFHCQPVIEGSDTRSLETDGNGRVFAGTYSGHLAVLDSDGKTLGFVAPDGHIAKHPVPFCASGIYALHHDRAGRLWVGTRGSGLYILNQNELTVPRNSIAGYQVNHKTPATDIFDINEDDNGRIWLATYKQGVMFFPPPFDAFHSVPMPEGDSRKVRRIEKGSDGMLILSTADGLFTLSTDFKSPSEAAVFRTTHEPGNTSSLMARDVLHAIRNIRDNRIVVSTMGGGLQITSEKAGLCDSIAMQAVRGMTPGLGNVQAMVQDQNGRIWVVGENTLRCMTVNDDGQLAETAVYGASYWGRDVEFCEAKTAIDAQTGNIYVGIMDGIIVFNPNKIEQSRFTPSLVFSGVQYQGDERITPLAGCETLTLPTDKHNAMVYFAALDYSDNAQIRYAWRICELDTAWSYVGTEHCAPLSNLPPGRFTLEVRSTNSDGLWVDNNALLVIDVRPTFWQSPWAWIIYAAILGGVLYTVFYIIRLRNNAKIEREMAERKLRLFTNVNNQLRTPLTLIGGPVTEVLQTETLSEQGRNFLEFVERNASDMITMLDTETKAATPDPFITSLTKYIEDNLSNENLKIEDIATALNVSRSVLYGKIKSIYDISPIDLVRDMRIKRACQLLVNNHDMNISEIAYATGFSEPKYFARSFKQRVGQTPSEYRKSSSRQ